MPTDRPYIFLTCDSKHTYIFFLALWQPSLLTDQNEISNLYRGPSIDASYQVSVQLAKQFQGRRVLEIDKSETRIACDGHVS